MPSAPAASSSPQPSCASADCRTGRLSAGGEGLTAQPEGGVTSPGGERAGGARRAGGEGGARGVPVTLPATCRYPAPSPSRFSLPSLKDQGAGSARPASRGAWAGTGGHSPFCSHRRYSSVLPHPELSLHAGFCLIQDVLGKSARALKGTPQAQPQACLLLARQSGSRPQPKKEGVGGVRAEGSHPALPEPAWGCTLPSSSQPQAREARPARPQAPWSHDGRAAG